MQVHGRVLIPAAAMLEVCRAAAQVMLDEGRASSSGSATAALVAANIPAPLILATLANKGPSGTLPAVRCVVGYADAGAVEVVLISSSSNNINSRSGSTTSTHLRASACQLFSSPAPVRLGRGGSRILCPWVLLPPPPVVGTATGSMDLLPHQAGPGYHCHPCTIDATLHLGLFAALQHGSVAASAPRVPVAAALFTGSQQACGGHALMWCDSGAASTASSIASYTLGPAGAGGLPAFTLQDLQSKAVSRSSGAQPQAGPQPQVLPTYAVRWQASAPAVLREVSTAWRHSNGLSLSGADGALRLPALGSTGSVRQGLQQALRLLQQQPARSSLQLVARESLAVLAPGSQPAGCGLLAASVAGMLKAASAETADRLQAKSASLDLLMPSSQEPAHWPAGDVFAAPTLLHSTWMVPLLERQQHEVAAPHLPEQASWGAVTISGGMGTLGLLAASWLCQQSEEPISLCLLGRSAASSLPSAIRLSATAAVSALQCDAAAAEDIQAAARLCTPVSLYIHAGGFVMGGMRIKLRLPTTSSANPSFM